MIMDERTEFADALALGTAGTGRQLVGDVVDTGPNQRDIGNGHAMYLVVQVDTAILSGGAATVQFELVSDAQAAIAVDGSATVHAISAAIPKASLIAGYNVVLGLPAEGVVYERYLGVIANVGTAALTAGKINAFLTPTPARWKAYPDAI